MNSRVNTIYSFKPAKLTKLPIGPEGTAWAAAFVMVDAGDSRRSGRWHQRGRAARAAGEKLEKPHCQQFADDFIAARQGPKKIWPGLKWCGVQEPTGTDGSDLSGNCLNDDHEVGCATDGVVFHGVTSGDSPAVTGMSNRPTRSPLGCVLSYVSAASVTVR